MISLQANVSDKKPKKLNKIAEWKKKLKFGKNYTLVLVANAIYILVLFNHEIILINYAAI
jgi:hypothetical protein